MNFLSEFNILKLYGQKLKDSSYFIFCKFDIFATCFALFIPLLIVSFFM